MVNNLNCHKLRNIIFRDYSKNQVIPSLGKYSNYAILKYFNIAHYRRKQVGASFMLYELVFS